MKGFEKQISKSAQMLRDKQNVTLLPPPSPVKIPVVRRGTQVWWASVAVAACVGFVLGMFTFTLNDEISVTKPTLSRVETVYDTVRHTICDTIYHIKTMPTAPIPCKQQLVCNVGTNLDTSQMEQASLLATFDTIGENILSDSINYELLVSM